MVMVADARTRMAGSIACCVGAGWLIMQAPQSAPLARGAMDAGTMTGSTTTETIDMEYICAIGWEPWALIIVAFIVGAINQEGEW